MVNIGLAVILAAVGIAITIYLVRLLTEALPWSLGSVLERWRVQRYLARATAGERQLQQGATHLALMSFQTAFYPYVANSRAIAQTVTRHHTALLSRLLAAADHQHGDRVRLLSLAKADRLLHERAALQQQYLKARERGAHTRQRDVETALETNAREVRAALAALVAEIGAVREPVRYH